MIETGIVSTAEKAVETLPEGGACEVVSILMCVCCGCFLPSLNSLSYSDNTQIR